MYGSSRSSTNPFVSPAVWLRLRTIWCHYSVSSVAEPKIFLSAPVPRSQKYFFRLRLPPRLRKIFLKIPFNSYLFDLSTSTSCMDCLMHVVPMLYLLSCCRVVVFRVYAIMSRVGCVAVLKLFLFIYFCGIMWMRTSRVVIASMPTVCRNSPGFDTSILRHIGIWGAARSSVE